MKNIDYYNLDNEYPVNYHFWKDLSAIFIYWGFYKPIIWKGGFKNETIKRIKNAFIDANQKIKSGVSFTEYELAKDKISHNYSSFRYYFERAEKISSFNLYKKIDWTISQVYRNIKPRISPYNKFCIEADFYLNAYEIIYNKVLIHYYAIKEFEIKPIRLAYDPLLLDENYDEKIKSDIITHEISQSLFEKSYLLECEFNLASSTYFKSIFLDIELFDKIDFSKLKEYNIIYRKLEQGLEYNDRVISDLSLLIIILDLKKIVKLPTLKYINKILLEIIKKEVSPTTFSECKTKYLNPQKIKPSTFDQEAIDNIILFISEYLKGL